MTNDKEIKNKRVGTDVLCEEVHGVLRNIYSGQGHLIGLLSELVTEEEVEAGVIQVEDIVDRMVLIADVIDTVQDMTLQLAAWVKANEPEVSIIQLH